MQELKQMIKVEKDNYLIKENLNILLYYDEPYLYYGQTEYGAMVIGAAVDEDEEQGINRHTHILVNRQELSGFLNHNISLRDLFYNYNKKIYIVDTLFNNGDITNRVYECDIENLPKTYIPSFESYCPVTKAPPKSIIYTLKTRDLGHQISLDYLGKAETKISSMLEQFSTACKHVLGCEVYGMVEAFKPSSFEIKVNLEFIGVEKKQIGHIFINEELICKFFNLYNKLIFEDITKDIDTLRDRIEENSTIKEIKELIEPVIQESKIDLEKIRTHAFKSYIDVIELWDEINEEIPTIEVSQSSSENTRNLIKVVDYSFKKNSEMIANEIENIFNIDTIEDSEFIEYSVLIYQLSKKTRNGKAYILLEKSNPYTVPITILGNEDLTGKIYTEAFYKGNDLKVLAKARKTRNKITKLSIKFEYEEEYDNRLKNRE